MNRNEVKKLLLEAKHKLKIEEDVSLVIKPMKRKIASISLTNKNLSIDKYFLENASVEEVRYVIFHELLHLKHGVFHTYKFKTELKEHFSIEPYIERKNQN